MERKVEPYRTLSLVASYHGVNAELTEFTTVKRICLTFRKSNMVIVVTRRT